MTPKSLRNLALATLVSIVTASAARALVIDFDPATFNFESGGGFFDIDGFRFTQTQGSTDGGFLIVTNQSDLIEGNTGKLFSANHNVITMTKVGGGTFSVASVDIGGSWTNPDYSYRWADHVDVSDGTNTGTAVLAGQGPSYVNLSLGFASVTSLTFTPTMNLSFPDLYNTEFTIDNIVVGDATSAPDAGSTMTLLGLALASLALVRRKPPA